MLFNKRFKELQDKLEEQQTTIDQLQDMARKQHGEICKLKGEVIGTTIWSMYLDFDRSPHKKTRIDRALDGNKELGKQLEAICDHLNITLRGKDEMPEFDVVEKEEESEKE